jgi:MFS family permease
MLGIEALPALMYLLLTLSIPDTPRWQILFQNNDKAALKILLEIYGDDQQAESVLNHIKSADVLTASQEKLMSKTNKKIIVLAFLISFFNQISGINFILYYAPEILEMAGFATRASLFNSVLIGLTNIIFTFAGLLLIDKLGRRQLLILGSLGYIISLSGVSIAFYFQSSPEWIALFIFAFIASHAVGQGTVIWVFISEIFPNRIRAMGQSFGAGVHWVFAALITLVGPSVIAIYQTNPWPIFLFFAVMMVLQLVFSIFTMPETKGKSLEEINLIINKN